MSPVSLQPDISGRCEKLLDRNSILGQVKVDLEKGEIYGNSPIHPTMLSRVA